MDLYFLTLLFSHLGADFVTWQTNCRKYHRMDGKRSSLFLELRLREWLLMGHTWPNSFSSLVDYHSNRLCGLVVRVSGYRSRAPGFDSWPYQILWEVSGLERGPLSLVKPIEELLEWKSSGSGLENRNKRPWEFVNIIHWSKRKKKLHIYITYTAHTHNKYMLSMESRCVMDKVTDARNWMKRWLIVSQKQEEFIILRNCNFV
jgi:hypothetical protein